MITDSISHKEATIQHFIEDPEFADFLMSEVIAEGNQKEISRFQEWYNEAQSRSQTQSYWSDVVNHAKNDVNNGFDLNIIFKSLNDALNIVKVAMA